MEVEDDSMRRREVRIFVNQLAIAEIFKHLNMLRFNKIKLNQLAVAEVFLHCSMLILIFIRFSKTKNR